MGFEVAGTCGVGDGTKEVDSALDRCFSRDTPASGDGAGGSVPARTDFDVRFDVTLLRGFLIVLATAADAVTDVNKPDAPETAASVLLA